MPGSPSLFADAASAADDPSGRDRELLRRMQADDAAALDELLALYWAPLIRYALRLQECEDGAEDLAQEAFIQLWQRRHACQGSVRAYLYQSTRNLALNRKRHREVRTRWAGRIYRDRLTQPPHTPDELYDEQTIAVALERTLAGLPERRREAFTLVRYHAMSYQEAAAVMGISPQTVANQVSAVLAELRHVLAPHLAGSAVAGSAAPTLATRRAEARAVSAAARASIS